eukprot:SAG31_NODE_44262_length_263_cov_0.951220_1_plen_34_part_10
MSLYFIGGSSACVVALFCITAVLSASMAVGYRTQ